MSSVLLHQCCMNRLQARKIDEVELSAYEEMIDDAYDRPSGQAATNAS